MLLIYSKQYYILLNNINKRACFSLEALKFVPQVQVHKISFNNKLLSNYLTLNGGRKGTELKK